MCVLCAQDFRHLGRPPSFGPAQDVGRLGRRTGRRRWRTGVGYGGQLVLGPVAWRSVGRFGSVRVRAPAPERGPVPPADHATGVHRLGRQPVAPGSRRAAHQGHPGGTGQVPVAGQLSAPRTRRLPGTAVTHRRRQQYIILPPFRTLHSTGNHDESSDCCESHVRATRPSYLSSSYRSRIHGYYQCFRPLPYFLFKARRKSTIGYLFFFLFCKYFIIIIIIMEMVKMMVNCIRKFIRRTYNFFTVFVKSFFFFLGLYPFEV